MGHLLLSILPALTLAPAGGLQGTVAFGVNSSGTAVGMSAWPVSGPGGQFASHAVRWSGGIATDLGAIPGFKISAARSINNSGEISGSGSNVFAGEAQVAVRWSPAGQMSQLNRLATHTTSSAWGINASGRIVGYSGIEDGDFTAERQPVIWDGQSVSALTLPAGFNQGAARSINDASVIVGSSAAFDTTDYIFTDFRATIWNSGSPSLLPLLAGSTASIASSVNAGGFAIGACYTDADSASFEIGGMPVLWDSSGVTDLRPMLSPFFPANASYTLSDINASGQITGFAVSDNGLQGFVLTIPTPSAGVLLGLAGLVAGRRRQRAAAIVALAAVASGASVASAQWTVTNLHPASADSSLVNGIRGGQQVGISVVAGLSKASLWSGTAVSWINLNPLCAAASIAAATDGVKQVGNNSSGFNSHAALWSGTAASRVNLNPPGANYSEALAIEGGISDDSIIDGNDFILFINAFSAGC